MKKYKEYAPVVIPTLSRWNHLERCIDSLRQNELSEFTELYIGLDYPPNESYMEGYEKVKAYLENGIDGFLNVNVFVHSKNMGPGGNLDFLRAEVKKKYTRFIETEDDNEFAPSFLSYINDCLEKYEADDSVVAVAGYNYPIDTSDFAGNTYYDDCYFAAFGFGTWVDKFQTMRDTITYEEFWRFYKNRQMMSRFCKYYPNQYCNMVKAALGYGMQVIRGNDIWKMDMTYGLYMFSHNKKMIYPTISKVRNWGYDGSGENCDEIVCDTTKKVTHRNFSFECQQLDLQKWSGEIVLTENISYDNIARRLDSYFEIPVVELYKVKAAYYISRIIGVDRARKLLT
ncbi:MAG: glycosyltransferase [Lachnospiraceae bacterium]|nr:glycosyltransferase [Candidatus Colinaster equi]